MSEIIELENSGLVARVNSSNGQLFSLEKDGLEYMFAGGAPDYLRPKGKLPWNRSELWMFPIVGAAKDGIIYIGGSPYRVDRHGVARHLDMKVIRHDNSRLVSSLAYEANTTINVPAKGKSDGFSTKLPHSFEITRRLALNGEGLYVHFYVSSGKPYDFGWHPAFSNLGDDGTFTIFHKDGTTSSLTLEDVQQSTRLFKDVTGMEYRLDKRFIKLTSKMGNLMLCSPNGSDIFFAEPVTRLAEVPYGIDTLRNMFSKKPTEKGADSYSVIVTVD